MDFHRLERPTHDDAERAGSEKIVHVGEVGYIHSWTTGSVVDGPGVRMVVWLTGCQFRCKYCHNPDTWKIRNGKRITADALLKEVIRLRRFMAAANGGLTLSGGEPLMQARFVSRIFAACKELGIHTALDTNGFLGDRLSDEELQNVDLVLLDLKSGDPRTHLLVTGQKLDPVVRFARRLEALDRPMWARFVLVPGLTDAPENVERTADLVASLTNVKKFEVLPFHQMGRFKWEGLGLENPLRDTPPASAEQVDRVNDIFRRKGVIVG